MGFFASQNPIASPREIQRRSITRRAPLHERTESQNNQSTPYQPTVRLVKSSPSESSDGDVDVEGEEENGWPDDGGAKPRLIPQSAAKDFETNQGLSASGRNFGVSEPQQRTNEAQCVDLAEDRALRTTLFTNNSQQTLPNPAAHRRSTSSGWYSQCSTLKSSEITLAGKSSRSHRSSQATTLRDIPTPHEQENRARTEGFDDDSDIAGLGPATALQPLQEERLVTTIRTVSDSDTSSPEEPRPGSQASEGTLSRPRTAPAESPLDSESPPSIPRRCSRRRAYSTGSEQTLPSIPNLPEVGSSPVIETYGSDSVTISEGVRSLSSSPNFVAYTPSTASVRPISRTGALRGTTSFDSINSRLQRYGSVVRPDTSRSLATQSSWASLPSIDTLPPLCIPKKRLRHKAALESLSSQALASSSSQPDVSMDSEDIDTLPYPKRPFSSHLSTIASESEGRTTSHHFSHWSYGSGVLTGDDVSSSPLSPINDGRGSAPVESMISSPQTQRTSLDEPGDMTLGIFREESAVPQPLFKPQAGPSGTQGTKKCDGQLPPIPPIPRSRDSDERVDTLSEMARPSLHQKRSGYSLRTRSNTTPGHSRQVSEISYVDSERNSMVSQGTGVFPIWARRFYSGTAALPSKLSLNSQSTGEARATGHRRGASSWTDKSITSRLGQDYSGVEPDSSTSSHFLPAIFRPRTRKKSQSNSRSSKLRKSQKSNKSKQSRPSREARPDSMAINPDPLPQSQDGGEIETLPSGQPRWGTLRVDEDPAQTRRPLRKYSKQGCWDEMEFPRPMTKDRLSDFNMQAPHLAPSKRTSQTRLSVWQAPSFVESLDTLIYCRCNRQVSFFVLGFIMPLFWMLGAVLPIPKRPASSSDLEKQINGSEDDVQVAMMRHEAGDAERRWREEKRYLKAKWWRMLNRIMSVIGLLLIGAIVALVVIATR